MRRVIVSCTWCIADRSRLEEAIHLCLREALREQWEEDERASRSIQSGRACSCVHASMELTLVAQFVLFAFFILSA